MATATGVKAEGKKATKVKAEGKKATKVKAEGKKLINPDLTRYVTVVVGEGKDKISHIDIDDLVARELRTHSLEEVYRVASLFSGKSQKELRERYGSLNSGMQRMNLGNRIRSFVKEGEYKTFASAVKDAEEAKKAS